MTGGAPLGGGRVMAQQLLVEPVERIQKTPLYALLAGLVLFASAVLLLLYPAMIAASGFGVYWVATEMSWLVSEGLGRGRLYGVALYLGIMLGAVVVTVSLVKPLLARPVKVREPYYVEPREAPGLYRLVRDVAAAVGAPTPNRIYVTCDVNASASFKRGVRSFVGDDLSLSIGLPLVGTLSTRELAGVIAHELGHFSQRTGMRVSYVLWSVNRWLVQVAYGRDQWDAVIATYSSRGVIYTMLPFWIAGIAVFVSRLFIRLLATCVIALNCAFARQGEYDADEYENRVAGTKAMKRTFVKMECLGYAQFRVHEMLSVLWPQRRLLDDVPGAIRMVFEGLDAEAVGQLKGRMLGKKGRALSTHPSDKQRIDRISKSPNPGSMNIDGDSRKLFSNFAVLCKASTMVMYDAVLGMHPEESVLVSAAEAYRPRDAAGAAPIPEGDIPLA